jgi:hypothetical protein
MVERNMSKKVLYSVPLWLATLAAFFFLAACSSLATANSTPTQPTITINPNFHSHISPIPTIPPYRCGAWASNNAPDPGATIIIYARLTHNTQGVQGIAASAVVHFRSGDAGLNQTTSDSGGYVTFSLPLQNRQPVHVPATVDVTFSGLPSGGSVTCTAFFTPM